MVLVAGGAGFRYFMSSLFAAGVRAAFARLTPRQPYHNIGAIEAQQCQQAPAKERRAELLMAI